MATQLNPEVNAAPEDRDKTHKTEFFIDEKFETDTNVFTPREIITLYAKEDPEQTTLVVVHGKERSKLEDLDKSFTVKPGTRFTLLHHGPTPVS